MLAGVLMDPGLGQGGAARGWKAPSFRVSSQSWQPGPVSSGCRGWWYRTHGHTSLTVSERGQSLSRDAGAHFLVSNSPRSSPEQQSFEGQTAEEGEGSPPRTEGPPGLWIHSETPDGRIVLKATRGPQASPRTNSLKVPGQKPRYLVDCPGFNKFLFLQESTGDLRS